MQQQVARLPRPLATAIVVVLLACAAAAWLITARQAASMTDGAAMMGAGLFLVTWLVMMVAMMFPSVAPMTLAFASMTRLRGEASVKTALFVVGYLAVWALSGVVPLGVQQAINQIWMSPPSW